MEATHDIGVFGAEALAEGAAHPGAWHSSARLLFLLAPLSRIEMEVASA